VDCCCLRESSLEKQGAERGKICGCESDTFWLDFIVMALKWLMYDDKFWFWRRGSGEWKGQIVVVELERLLVPNIVVWSRAVVII